MTIDQTDKIERMATLVARAEWSMAMKRETYIRADSMLGMSRRTHVTIWALIVLVALALGLALAPIFIPSTSATAPAVPYPNISDFFAHPGNLPAPSAKP